MTGGQSNAAKTTAVVTDLRRRSIVNVRHLRHLYCRFANYSRVPLIAVTFSLRADFRRTQKPESNDLHFEALAPTIVQSFGTAQHSADASHENVVIAMPL
jgi:hypothetical protein